MVLPNKVIVISIFLGRYENVTAKYKYSEKMTKQNSSNDENRYNNTQSFAVVIYKDDSLKKGDKSWINYPAQNLSTVLNDPRKGARETDIFTRIWGESFVPHEVVPLTLLPNTPKSFFNDYWKKYEFVRYLLITHNISHTFITSHQNNCTIV